MATALTHRQLAMQEPRIFEDFRLVDSPPERIKEITVVESAYDSVLCADFTYVSTPITSGAILYDALDRAGLTDLNELRKDKDFFYNNVILPNIQAADATAKAMLMFGGAVIAPAIFEAKSLAWGQDEYMGLWLDTIERKATRIAMVDGWQYSNGGCEEYLQALLMQAGRRDRNDIWIVDARGKIIPHETALRLMLEAITSLINRNFKPTVLLRVLNRCMIVHDMVADESLYGITTDRNPRQSFSVGRHYCDASMGKNQMRDINHELNREIDGFGPLLDKAERAINSSVLLQPGLVRESEREDLITQPSKTIKKE